MVRNFNSFILDRLYPLSLKYGQKMCHQFSDRSFHVGIRQYPVCARCTGIYVGIFIGLLSAIFYKLPLNVCIVLLLPMLLDGYIQLKTSYNSNNIKRLITGLLFGYSLVSIVVYALDYGMS